MGDDGGTALLEGLSCCNSLVDLNLSANDLGSRSAVAISHVLGSAEAKLTYLDISSNAFRVADVMRISRSMDSNNVSRRAMLSFLCPYLQCQVLTSMDLRIMSGSIDDSECVENINCKLRMNEIRCAQRHL